MFIFAIERSGIAVASRQAATETTATSIIAMTGTVTSCKVSVFAAPTKIQQTYPNTAPITDAKIA